MKICASVKSPEELDRAGDADLIEVGIDTYRKLDCAPCKPMIVKVSTQEELLEMIGKKWDGYLDIGELPRPDIDIPVISSVRDDVRTMSSQEIIKKMTEVESEISVGTFMVNRPADLVAIYDASTLVRKRHVLTGLGEMGSITRYRSQQLGNDFDYAHVGTPSYLG